MMAYSEDHIALAAEYALGTLDADERVQVETMMAVDTEFTAIVHAWEHRLAGLTHMGGSGGPPAAPVVAEQPAASEPAPVADTSNVIRLASRERRWRNIACFASALAAALI